MSKLFAATHHFALVIRHFHVRSTTANAAEVAEQQKRSPVVIVVMGTMTGVAGGVVRDVLSGVAPVLLRRDIYATAAVVGISAYLLAQRLGMERRWAYCGGIALTVAVRLLALEWDWQLPVFHFG